MTTQNSRELLAGKGKSVCYYDNVDIKVLAGKMSTRANHHKTKRKGKENNKLKKNKKDNDQLELTKFFATKDITNNTIIETINPSVITQRSSPWKQPTKSSPWKQPTKSSPWKQPTKSSPWKQPTPKTDPKMKRMSLKRPRSCKKKTTPSKATPSKQRRLDEFKNFTPTKLGYLLHTTDDRDISENNHSPQLMDTTCIQSSLNDTCTSHDKDLITVNSTINERQNVDSLFVNEKETDSDDTSIGTTSSKAKRTLLFNNDLIEENVNNGVKKSNHDYNNEGEIFEESMIVEQTPFVKESITCTILVTENQTEERQIPPLVEENKQEDCFIDLKEEIETHNGDLLYDVSFSDDSNDELDELLCNFSITSSHDNHMTLPLRYKVQHVDYQNYRDENDVKGRVKSQLVIELISLEQQQQGERLKATCYLRDDWVQTDIRYNDTVHIVHSYSTTTLNHHSNELVIFDSCQNEYIISNDSGSCIIVNPDYLISGTTIANGITCTRRAVLEELFKGYSEQNEIMLIGKSLHDIFQQTITAASKGVQINQEYVIKLIPPLVHHISTIQQLYSLNLTESELKEQLMEYVPVIVQWCNDYQTNSNSTTTDSVLPQKRIEWKRTQTSVSEMMNVSVSQVLDIEENVWSPRYGLKGKVDATVQVKVTDGKNYFNEFLAPLELKTGKKSSIIQHRAQVLLYCLMLCDSHMIPVPSGLLYYMKVNETSSVPAKDIEIRALLMARNHLARYHGNHWDHVTLPEMIKEPRTCRYCPLLSHCTLYHKSFEQGTVITSGLREHYPHKIDHMTAEWVEFYKHWHRLVVEELTYEQVQSINDLIWRTDIENRVNEGCCISDLLSCQPEPLYQSQLRNKQTFIKQKLKNNFHIFNCYDRIVVSRVGGASGRSWAVAMGYILTINEHSYTLALDKSVPVGNIYCIDMTPPRVGGVVLSTLAAVCSSDGEREQQLRELVIDLKEPQYLPASTVSFSTAEQKLVNLLNEDQKKAVEKVLLAKDYSLILGMPGTGKTTTIACLIELLITREHSVLLTSFTNSAVDNVLIKLLEKDVDFIRLGSIGRVHSSVSAYSVHQLTQNITSLNQLTTLYQGKLLVATTCHSVDHPLFKDRIFDYCIMDEAGQIPLPLSLAPLKLASRFVLVGDHYQLPPLVRSPVAKKGGYEESLFKRLSTAHPFTLSSLTLQHRMNKDIMHLSNQLIYNNLLQCASDEVATAKLDVSQQQLPLGTPNWLNTTLDSNASVVFLNTDKCGLNLEDKSGEQISNLFEANHIIEIIQSLIKVGVDPSDILVITQYKHQQRLIARLLFELKAEDKQTDSNTTSKQTDSHTTSEQTDSNTTSKQSNSNVITEQSDSHTTSNQTDSHTTSDSSYESVEVLTVDKCQGRDKSCVLISFVRSNTSGKVGTLLLNWQRINVALTRAKHKLVFIGSCDTLSNAPYLLKLIKLIENHHSLIDINL